MIRRIADEAGRPTVLYDEVDALFGAQAADKADLIALLNAGHRKGATSGRCVVGGVGGVTLEDLPAYCALALAGLKALPDALATRSILIEMRPRAEGEKVGPFRLRINGPQAKPICADLTDWCAYIAPRIAGKYPDLPADVTDRQADCWEPLLAVAEAAGGDWPKRARAAAVYLVRRGRENIFTADIELLEHIKEAFGEAEGLWTEKLLKLLIDRSESPLADIRGKPLTDRGLAVRLRPYKIKSRQVRIGDYNRQGYLAADFKDAWDRYLKNKDPEPKPENDDPEPELELENDDPEPENDASTVGKPYKPYSPYGHDNKQTFVGLVGDVGDEDFCPDEAEPYKPYKPYIFDKENKAVGAVGAVGDPDGQEEVCSACDGNFGKGCPTCMPENYGLPPRRKQA
jgi:Protein of unknown function (DUF3631)